MPLTQEEYALLRSRIEAAERMQQLENVEHRIAGLVTGLQISQQAASRQAQTPRPQLSRQPAPQPRVASPATLPAVLNGNARFDPSHLKMKPAVPQLDAVKDSYVFSPGATIRQR
jgi:hypothetical protein